MKKLLISVIAAVLPLCLCAQEEIAAVLPLCLCAQEESEAPYIDFSVIGRLEADPSFPFEKGKHPNYSSGNSVIYTNFDAAPSENWHFSWVSHWFDTGGARIPFENTPYLFFIDPEASGNKGCTFWRSDLPSFVDYLYVDYMTHGLTFRLGKDCTAVGGFEYEDWDWDCTFNTVSPFWLMNNSYQWGGSIAYTTESEMTSLMFQASSTPYSEKPWKNGLGQYFFKHSGEYGNIETINAIGFQQTEKSRGIGYVTLSLKYNILDNLNAYVEYMSRIYSQKIGGKLPNSGRFVAQLKWSPLDELDVTLKGGYERLGISAAVEMGSEIAEVVELPASKEWFAGATVAYYPISNNRDLRIQATLAGNSSIGKGIGLTVGVIYNHCFHLLK